MITPHANAYIGIVTDRFKEAAAFYVKHFGYTVNAEKPAFICVQAPNGKRALGFSAPSTEKGLSQSYAGGIHLPFLVDDADAAFNAFKDAGIPIKRGITIESWGEKHFVINDPAGIELYISEPMSRT